MKIHSVLPTSNTNGSGTRFVIWLQGCSRKCQGCFNPATHDVSSGYELSISEIIEQIPLNEVAGITVSGGEPFEQSEELAELLERTGEKGLDRLVYTGFTYEELASKNDKTIDKCLLLINTLIDGPFIHGIPPFLPWIGSGNQRILGLKDGKIAKIYKKSDFKDADKTEGEIIIDKNGMVTATGILNSVDIFPYL